MGNAFSFAPWELSRGDTFETWLESSLRKKIPSAFSLCKRFHQYLPCWSLDADSHHINHYMQILDLYWGGGGGGG